MGMVLSLLAGCGGQNKAGADSGQPAQDNKGSGKTASGDNGDGYTGISAIEACEWAADKYPDAKLIRYTDWNFMQTVRWPKRLMILYPG